MMGYKKFGIKAITFDRSIMVVWEPIFDKRVYYVIHLLICGEKPLFEAQTVNSNGSLQDSGVNAMSGGNSNNQPTYAKTYCQEIKCVVLNSAPKGEMSSYTFDNLPDLRWLNTKRRYGVYIEVFDGSGQLFAKTEICECDVPDQTRAYEYSA